MIVTKIRHLAVAEQYNYGYIGKCGFSDTDKHIIPEDLPK